MDYNEEVCEKRKGIDKNLPDISLQGSKNESSFI